MHYLSRIRRGNLSRIRRTFGTGFRICANKSTAPFLHNGKRHYLLIPLSHNVPPPTGLLHRSPLQASLTCALQQRLNETPTAARRQHIQMPACRDA